MHRLMLIPFFWLGVLELSAGFQQVKLGERGGRRRDFHDVGINTRQAMEHVKHSKSGQSTLEYDVDESIKHTCIWNHFWKNQKWPPERSVCVCFFRNSWYDHWVDGKLLPHPVPPAVGSLSVPCGLQPANGVSSPADCSPVSARWSAWLSAELWWSSAFSALQVEQQGDRKMQLVKRSDRLKRHSEVVPLNSWLFFSFFFFIEFNPQTYWQSRCLGLCAVYNQACFHQRFVCLRLQNDDKCTSQLSSSHTDLKRICLTSSP